jgi:hypothetical protein
VKVVRHDNFAGTGVVRSVLAVVPQNGIIGPTMAIQAAPALGQWLGNLFGLQIRVDRESSVQQRPLNRATYIDQRFCGGPATMGEVDEQELSVRRRDR